MKEKIKILEDKPKALGEEYVPLEQNKNNDNFVLVVERQPKNYRIIDDLNMQNDIQDDDVQENEGEKIYYAEEIFDDEDDIYLNQMHDSLLQKEHHRTFMEIGSAINGAMLANGYKTTIGLSLLASMQFSRFIYLPKDKGNEAFVKALMDSVSTPLFMTTFVGGQDDFLAYSDVVYRAFEYARINKNRPVFIYTNELTSKGIMEYYRHFYPYIDNPEGDNYLTALGRSLYIPHNVYFIFSLKEGEIEFDIARRLYRYVTYLDFTSSTSEVLDAKENVIISLEELYASLREASDKYGIREDMWKKFDGIIEMINEVNGFSLQNKIARRLEDYAIAYFTSPLETTEVMDVVLANNFIHEAILTSRPQLYHTDYDLNRVIDNNFGPESLPLTRKVFKSYLDLFDKGGNRLDE